MSVAVVFLARGIDGGVPAVVEFMDSYRRHPAGWDHHLYLLAKGWDGEDGYDTMRQHAAEVSATVIDLPDDGFDWGAYFRAAERVSEEWICCLNTHSRIECDNWLGLLMGAAAAPGVGAAGCTGNLGTVAPVRQFIRPIIAEVARNKGLLKALIAGVHAWVMFLYRWPKYVGQFKGFPNPHLRSNAFVMRRGTLRAFAARSQFPSGKYDAFALESGREGLTRFLEHQGLGVRVAGADGTSFTDDQWVDSRTFRALWQDNLVVSDNQTRTYETETRAMRRILEICAWGRFFTP